MKTMGPFRMIGFLSFLTLFFLLSLPAASATMLTYVKEYHYQASEGDSKLSCRTVAFEQVKRLLLEELGTYLMSETEVKDFDLTKDKITSLSAGIVSTVILEEKWDGQIYFLKAKITTDTAELIKMIDRIRGSQDQTRDWEAMRKRTEDALREIEKLKEEIRKGNAQKAVHEKYARVNDELSAVEWLKKGLALRYTSRNDQEALKAFNRAIEIDPNYARAYALKAAIYNDWGQYQDGLRESDRAVRLDPGLALALNSRGVARTGMRDYREGIKDFNKAIGLEPKYASPYYNRSWANYGLKNYRQGVEDANKAIQLDPNPNTPYSYYHRAKSLAALGNYQEAIEDYGRAIQIDPTYSWSFFYRGLAFMNLGKIDQAREDFKKAASLGNKEAQSCLRADGTLSAVAWYTKGLRLRSSYPKNNREALKAFDKAIEIDPNYAQAYLQRAYIYNDGGQYPESLRESDRAIKLDPKLAMAFNSRGVARTGMRDYREGIKDFNKAIELDPKYASPYYNRSLANYGLKNYRQGVEDANKAIQLDPNTPYSYYHRARSLAALGNYQEAIEDYGRAIQIDPTHSFSFYSRGLAFMDLGKEEQALEDFKKAASLGNKAAQSLLQKKGIKW